MVMRKEKIKKIAFSLAEAMISMLIISAIATMSIKLFAGQKTKKAADMAHNIMGCYMMENGAIAAMSMEIGKPDTLMIEAINPNGSGYLFKDGHEVTPGAGVTGIGNIKLFYNSSYKEEASEHFNYTPTALTGAGAIEGPFCAVDVTETLSSTARTIAMIGGGGFGFMSSNAENAMYNRPGDTGFFATYNNLDFTRPGIYRFYPGQGASPYYSGDINYQAAGDSNNRQGGPSRLVYIPTTINASGVMVELRGTNNENVEILSEVRGGYSRNHYYPLGPIPLSDVGCDDSGSCRFEGTSLWIAAEEGNAARARHCTPGMAEDDCSNRLYENNWHKYSTPDGFFAAASALTPNYKNYITKTVPLATGGDTVQSYFAGSNLSDNFNSWYMGGTMIATAASNRITIGMNDLAPRCANDMHEFLKITANSTVNPTIFTGTTADSFLYTFGTGGACSNYHNLVPGTDGMPGKGGAVFVIW